MVESDSRTVKVSGATRNLEEAAGKIPARRTENAYEKAHLGEKANRFKAQLQK